APPERPSARFCRIRAVLGTFPCLYREKTPLMILARLHGYARKCMSTGFRPKIRPARQNPVCSLLKTVNGREIYCVAVRRWQEHQA
ncbi:hypothetical protein OIL49_23055, partial [Salmonella enterica subsp. enterica serovar Corvallis]|nr:hypothetical protein [Salmonella enterica subsp. enterica serovar Corvallis]